MEKNAPSNEFFYACYLLLCIVQGKKQLQHEFEFFLHQFFFLFWHPVPHRRVWFFISFAFLSMQKSSLIIIIINECCDRIRWHDEQTWQNQNSKQKNKILNKIEWISDSVHFKLIHSLNRMHQMHFIPTKRNIFRFELNPNCSYSK